MSDDIWGIVGLAVVGTIIVFTFVFSALALPFIGVGAVLLGGVYYYFHSPAYREKKAREHTHALYEEARAKYRAAEPEELAASIVEELPETPLAYEFGEAILAIIEEEHLAAIPEPPLVCDSLEGARYRDKLSRMTQFPSPERGRELLATAFRRFVYSLPQLPARGPFSVPLIDLLDDPEESIEALVLSLYEEDGLFVALRKRLDQNAREVSPREELIRPSDYTGENIAYAYLKDTPFLALLDAQVPFAIPRATRFEHCIITGGSGHGKTQLLQRLILDDLDAEDPPSLVVVDSQGDMLEKIARLERFTERELIILAPSDAPALNIFDINQQRLRRYGKEQREQVLNHTLETFSYLFNSIIGADLTVKQATLFNYLIYLMLAMPESMGRSATLLDLMKLMDDAEPYRPAIEALDPIPRDFFLRDFHAKQYVQTKEQIRYRLQAIVGNPTLARLFLAPANTVDFFDELNRGTVILVDTDKAFLGAKNSSYLGRIAIALILQAILERAATPGFKRPVHLYVDEAGEYFDKSIDTFLTEARKQSAGITLAHQYLGQMAPELRGSVAANTSIKFAGGLSNQDAKAVAADMRTDPQFILDQPKLTFACHIRGHTKRAVALTVTPGMLEDEPAMTEEEYRAMRARNRERVSATFELPDVPEPPEPPSSVHAPDAPTSDW